MIYCLILLHKRYLADFGLYLDHMRTDPLTLVERLERRLQSQLQGLKGFHLVPDSITFHFSFHFI